MNQKHLNPRDRIIRNEVSPPKSGFWQKWVTERATFIAFLLCFTTAQAQIAFDTVYTAPSTGISFWDMECKGKTCYVSGNGGTNSTPFMIKTTDGGDTWSVVTNGLPGTSYAIACTDENNCATTVYNGANNTGWYTSNGGQNWQQSTGVVNNFWKMHHVNGDTLLAAEGGSNMYISYNKGQTWQFLKDVVSQIGYIQIINSDFWVAKLGTTSTILVKSSNKGQTWDTLNSIWTQPNFHFINPIRCYSNYTNRGLCYSDDFGVTWKNVDYQGRDTTINNQLNVRFITSYDTMIFATSSYYQVVNANGWKGESYANIQNSMPYCGSENIYLSKDTILSNTGSQIARSLYGTTSIDITSSIYESTTKVYPNPFVDRISINNDLNIRPENVKIYDYLGNLINLNANFKNELELTFLKPGLYIVSLQLSNYLITKKIIKL